VLQDQLAGVQRAGETDLALLTDGLSAEREQGITIDVAYRYFATAGRKFIIGDAPGHEQYTRNMVTAASSADAAVVLVDATKLDWKTPALELLPQTRRHSLLVNLLRVPSIVFAVNKLDAVEDPTLAFRNIAARWPSAEGRIASRPPPCRCRRSRATTWSTPSRAGAATPGLSLLQLLEHLPATPPRPTEAFAFPVQWVEKFSSSADTSQGRRVFWGRVATGGVQPGQSVTVLPSAADGGGGPGAGPRAPAQDRWPATAPASCWTAKSTCRAATGCWPPDSLRAVARISATVAWLDDEPLVAGASTGRCTATAGSRPRSSASCTSWT
jgi:sulfate adenylyltransferase subunit 1